MRRLLAAAAAVLVTATPAGAQTDEPPADGRVGDHFVVVSQTPWVVPGGTFAVRVRVDDPPDDATVRIAVHQRVRSRSEFARALEGRSLRSVAGERTVLLDAVSADAEGTRQLRVPTGTLLGEEPVASLTAAGVYPTVIELRDGDDEVVDRIPTAIVRLPTPDPVEVPLAFALVVPVHARPAHVAPGEIDNDAVARVDVVLDALLAHPQVALTLVPTPESLAAAVEADPNAATRIADAADGRQVLGSTWVRLDPTAWSSQGLADELQRQLDAGQSTVRELAATDPDTTTAVVPTTGAQGAVTAMVDRGVDAVVVPEAALQPLPGDDFPVTLTRPFEVPVDDGDEAPTIAAVVADTALAAHAGSTGDPVLDAHHLLADLAVLAFDAPVSSRGAVAVLDDEAVSNAAFLEALLGALGRSVGPGAAPLVEPTTVTDILTSVEPAAPDGGVDRAAEGGDPLVRTFADDDAAPPRLGSLGDDLAAARSSVSSYRSVFGADAPLAADVEELVLTAGASTLDAEERQALLDRGLDVMRAELAGIHGPPRQRVTLTAREGQVQLVLGNDTGVTADVRLELRGDRLEFPDFPDGIVPVRLDPGPTTRIDLNVRARSSGDAPLDLRVASPDGRVELGRSRVTVRTTAVSGVGLVLMGAAALFLVVWWTRTILRERGATRRRPHAHER